MMPTTCRLSLRQPAIRSLLLVALLLITSSLSAQITHASQGRLDENASDVLKKAAAKFNQSVAFTVTATMLDSEKHPTSKQSASVRYHKGKYHLVLPDQEIISDGITLWHWNKVAKEVAISNVATDEIDLLNPGSLLANYSHLFKPKYIRTDDGTAVIDLQPRSAQRYHKLRLFIRESDGLLLRIEVHKYDSSRELYEVANFKRVVSVPSQFTFTPTDHKDVEVIDMR